MQLLKFGGWHIRELPEFGVSSRDQRAGGRCSDVPGRPVSGGVMRRIVPAASHAGGAPSPPCLGACARSVNGDSTHPIGRISKCVFFTIASNAGVSSRRGLPASGLRAVQALEEFVGRELDFLVPPFGCPVLAGDEPH